MNKNEIVGFLILLGSVIIESHDAHSTNLLMTMNKQTVRTKIMDMDILYRAYLSYFKVIYFII